MDRITVAKNFEATLWIMEWIWIFKKSILLWSAGHFIGSALLEDGQGGSFFPKTGLTLSSAYLKGGGLQGQVMRTILASLPLLHTFTERLCPCTRPLLDLVQIWQFRADCTSVICTARNWVLDGDLSFQGRVSFLPFLLRPAISTD